MTTAAQWLEGARPRTLPAALAPVLVGSGAAAADGGFRPGRALLALVVALALQVGVNYANDYSDGVRGTDADRVGPLRLVGSGTAPPRAVLQAALACAAVVTATILGLRGPACPRPAAAGPRRPRAHAGRPPATPARPRAPGPARG